MGGKVGGGRTDAWAAGRVDACAAPWRARVPRALYTAPPARACRSPQGKKGGAKKGKPSFRRWSNGELADFYAALLQLGPSRAEEVRKEVRWATAAAQRRQGHAMAWQ